MARIHAESSAVIDAPPAEVYALISDYREAHPRILPREHFSDLKVEEGGQGAGTVITFVATVGGTKQTMRGRVAEPEPGRILTENYTTSSMVTSFTVDPVESGGKSRVTIATDMDPSPGLRGLIERIFVPGALRSIYVKELRQLNEVASAGRADGGGGAAD
jgi:hypothetical protein